MNSLIDRPASADLRSLRTTEPPAFLPYLEGLRGVAALYVVFFHAYNELTRDRPLSTAHLPFNGIFLRYGHFSVALFICISGYVLSLPIAKHGALRGGAFGFFKRRARRLLPAYYVALALSVPFGLYNEHAENVAFHLGTFVAQLGSHILLLHNFAGNPQIFHGLNGALWTIPVEFQIYAVFALVLVPLWLRFGLAAMVAGAFALGLVPELVGIAQHHPAFFRLGTSCFWFFGLFALGSAAALSARTTRAARIPWGPVAAVLGFTAVAAIVAFAPAEGNQTLASGLDILLGLATAASFIFVAQKAAHGERPLVARLLDSRVCVTLGTFSYSLYLVHEPIIRAITHRLACTGLSDTAVVAIVYSAVVPALVAFAFVFSLAFERPFISTYRRNADKRLIAGGTID